MNLLFDLDGTLTDPAVGITRCIQHALEGMRRQVPPTGELLRFIGPPLRGTFQQLLETSDSEVLDEAIRLYRARFATVGMFENEVYPGVQHVLRSLKAAGHRLWVVTSKPHVYARQIVQHFELMSLFDDIYGSELSGENVDKTDLIRIAIAREGLAASRTQTWMIGDRAQDVLGARANGVSAVGALWGYGTPEELRAAEPTWCARSIDELRRWIA